MARRKKFEEGHSNHERWLITYADLITLLMIFFVVMYSMSNIDAKKYEELAKSLTSTFVPANISSGGGGGGAGGSVGLGEDDQGLPEEEDPDPGDVIDPELQAAAEQIRRLLQEHGLESRVSVDIKERGVVIGLMNTVLFEPGSTRIKDDAVSTLVDIGKIAKNLDNYIRIEGNTDDVPMNTPQIPSNWELSVLRATEVLRLLIDQSGISPEKISAVGYGEYRPSFPNTSAENRSKNRKVDIVLLSSSFDKSESSQDKNEETE